MPEITLPLWVFAILFLLAVTAVLDRLLVPSVRWFLQQRALRVIDEVNSRLRLEIKPFQRTRRQVLIDRLLYDPKVQEAIEERVRTDGTPRDVVMQRVESYAREIVPAFNAYAYFRLGYALSRRIARMLYRVRLGYSDDEGLARIPPHATVVFVMNHRSNMDYVLVSYLAMDRAALSYAVGEWARIWPLQTLIRAMGAYFVRRDSGDALYRRVLERYVCMATEAGVTQALYPEGRLSRDGHLRRRKLGLLDYLLRGYEAARAQRDLVFVPVGINYDRVLEDRTLLLEVGPAQPRPGRLAAVSTALRFVGRNLALLLRRRWYRFGYACVNFGSPISVQDFLHHRSLELSRLSAPERRALVQSLGDELMAAVAALIPVLPVPLVATVFVRHPERRWSELELKAEVYTLMQQLGGRGAHLYLPRQDQDYAIAVGLRMLVLRRLVRADDGLFQARGSELPLLRYYANSIAHLLARVQAPRTLGGIRIEPGPALQPAPPAR
jgi:glycerol-3-phosphate O-acyltransferase